MSQMDSVGWGVLVVLVPLFGMVNLTIALRPRANPDGQTPKEMVVIKFVGIMVGILLPLMFIVLSNPPIAGQPWLGVIEFIYLVASYALLWRIWGRTDDWRMKFCLLILFIFLPDYVWLMNVSKSSSDTFPTLVGVVQLVYLFGGFFIFKHYLKKIRPEKSNAEDA